MSKNNLIKKMISLLCVMLLTVSTVLVNLPSKVFAGADTAPPTNFTELSWESFGLEYKTYPAKSGDLAGKGTYSGSLHQTLLNGNITFGGNTDIRYGGTGWTGIVIEVAHDGSVLYMRGGTYDVSYTKEYYPADYGLTSFKDTEFNLKISTEISEDNYTFGVWVNNQMLGDYFTLTKNADTGAGSCVGLYDRGSGNSIALSKAPEVNPLEDFTELSWESFGLEYKTYPAKSGDLAGKGTYSGSLHQTLLNGNITFGGNTDIRYGGTGWTGIVIEVAHDGSVLYMRGGTYDVSYTKEYYPADYGLTSFKDTEFNLKISTEISGDNYTFGVWVNDQMLGDFFTLTKNADTGAGSCVGLYDRGSGNSITLSEIVIEPPTDPIEPPTDFTELSWTDFVGLEYKEYAAPNPDLGAKGTYAGDLNRTLLNGNIIMGSDVDIRFPGIGWTGVMIRTLTDGTLHVENSTFDTAYNATYQPSDYGLTSFIGNEFNIKISTEISGNDYTFGIWVNDKMLGDYFTLTEATDGEKGTSIGLYHRGSNHNITLVEVKEEPPVDPDNPPTDPIDPPTDFTELSWTDFVGLEYKEYAAPNPDLGAKGTYAGDLNRTLLNGNIIMGSDVDIRFAGIGWTGVMIRTLTDGTLHVENSTFDTAYNATYQPSDYGLTSFIGNEFNIKISTEISGNDYTFGIWVNDKMLGDYFTLTEATDGEKGTSIGLYHRGSNHNITLVEVKEEPPVDPDNPPTDPIDPPADFTELSWTDFVGLEYKEYATPNPDLGAKGTYADDLNRTLLNGNIIMGSDADIRFAGNGWTGVMIRTLTDGTLHVENSTFDTAYNATYQPSDYGLTSFIGNEFNIKISTEISGNDYTFGIWVNDKMLGDYFTLTEAADGEKGTSIGLYHRGSNHNITLVEVEADTPPINPDVPPVNPDNPPTDPINPPTDFTEIDWESFGLRCKEYPAISGNLAGKGTYLENLNGTLFNGDIIFGKGTDIRYAGTGWSGIILEVAHDGSVLYVRGGTYDDSYNEEYYPADYGLTSFADTEFNLKISTEIVEDNYTFGIWVNDKVLGDYFTLTKNTDTAEGSCVGLYDRGTNNSITLIGEPEDSIPTEPIPVPNDFTVITLEEFGGTVRPGKLNSNAAIAGKLETQNDFDEIVFNADVNIATDTPGNATYIRFAGSAEGWVGIGLETKSDGTLVLMNWRNAEILQSYTEEVAGVDFFEESFNLKISFAYVDSDGDGKEDDVQIGVYFNDVLYNNELVVARDYEMTNWLLAFTDDADAHPLEMNNPKKQTGAAIKPDKGLKEISFSSFGIEDADFTNINVVDLCASGSYYDLVKGKTLDGTLFHGLVKFSKNGDTELRFGGLSSAWCGIRITGRADGTIELTEAELNTPEKQFSYLFTTYAAECELVGTWLDLMISMQFVDHDGDGVKDDVKLGIWFNDVLYDNEYIYLDNYAPHMGSYMSVFSYNEKGHISIRSVEVDNKIELTLFGFDDNYKAYFKSSEKDTVKGVPLGVTAEYETVDYHFDTKYNASNDNQDDENENVGQIKTLPYGILILSGVALVGVVALIIFLIVKKRIDKYNSNN